MIPDKLQARLEERESKKGTKYSVLLLKLTDTYEKVIFLDQAEIELLKMQKTPVKF